MHTNRPHSLLSNTMEPLQTRNLNRDPVEASIFATLEKPLTHSRVPPRNRNPPHSPVQPKDNLPSPAHHIQQMVQLVLSRELT